MLTGKPADPLPEKEDGTKVRGAGLGFKEKESMAKSSAEVRKLKQKVR